MTRLSIPSLLDLLGHVRRHVVQSVFVDAGLTASLAAALVLSCGVQLDRADRGSTMTVLADEGDRYTIRRGQATPLLFLPVMIERFGEEGVPRLAESWEHSDDYRTWTYRLRDDVRWHDGVAVTAHDIAFSIELFNHPDVLWATWTWGGNDSISVPDDRTLTLHRSRPTAYPPLAGEQAFPVPKHLLEKLDRATFYRWDFWLRPVGNGPYRFVRHIPRTMFELEANADFYAGEPSIERVIVKLGNTNRVLELTSGAADVVLETTPTEVKRFAADPEFVVYRGYDWLDMAAIYWNQSYPPFADSKVRHALNHAIDRREIGRLVDLPDDMPLVGGFSDPQWGSVPYREWAWGQGPAHDPGLAAVLLTQAGWIDADGDGIRERDGRKLEFTLTVSNDAWIRGVDQGLLIQQQLQEVGVAVEVRALEYALWTDSFREGDFEAAIYWFENHPPSLLGDYFDPSPFGYHNPVLIRLLQSLETTPEQPARDSVYRRLNAILMRDMPLTFFFPRAAPFVAHRRIRGFRSTVSWNALALAEELWIEEQP